MEVAVFDISGDYAFFKSFETTRANYSYPFPPRTALLGLIAAILGYDYNSYWNDHPLNQSKYAIEILSPIKHQSIKMNYTQSRKIMKILDIEIILPKDPSDPDARGFTTQVKLDLLEEVHYRIYFYNPNQEIFQLICNALEKNHYKYTPYLGHANLLCELLWIGRFPIEKNLEDSIQVKCLIPVNSVDLDLKLNSGIFNIISQVPMEYFSESFEIEELNLKKYKIQPIRFESVIIQEKNATIGITVKIKKKDAAFKISLYNENIPLLFFS